MPGQEYQVRVTADTRQATDKLDAVQNELEQLTSNSHNIKLNVDANSLKRTVEATNDVANNIRNTKASIAEASGFNIVSANSLTSAAALASTFYGIRKDVAGLNQDLGKATAKTNLSEFLRTNQFLDRLLDNSRSRTKEIAETYKNIRELPGTEEVLGPVENFARVKAWETYGSQIAGATVEAAKKGVISSVQETKKFFYGEVVDDFKAGLNSTIDTLARLGLAIQGVQLLVGPLAAAWSAAFDAIIGQNVRLEQTMLSTQTTLASTGRVINETTGQEITDPLQKIQALESGVRTAVNNIRSRSLDLAGVTSQQIIEIFGVVATSISQVNGNIKDAEDLSISFTAALGTLGIPFYQARQEIGSILGGYITEDSLLAKRLQISNADIAKAKSSIDGVVGYLKKKLETAVAGQAIQSKGFAGVTSNIKEIFEVITQRVGAPLLAPLVGGLTVIYNALKKIQGVVADVGEYLAKVFANTVNSIAGIFQSTKLAQSIAKFFESLAAPYEMLARSTELGLGSSVPNLIEAWLNGTRKVPEALKGVIAGLASFSNFVKLQIDLITEPVKQLIDQSRELATGGAGVAQRAARIASIPFGNFIELGDTFTKGWDTLTSTIQAAATALTKFAVALVKLKITEITSQIRAAASVFEVFGSVILGKINLATSFFDNIGAFLGTDLAKFTVSLIAINKLVNSTDFFGIKGIAIWAVQTRQIFLQLMNDARLFAKGFKDANNIDKLLSNAQTASAKALGLQKQGSNTVLKNAADIELLTQKLTSLKSLQAQMAAEGAGEAAMTKYAKAIETTSLKLGEAKQVQEKFTNLQRMSAGFKSMFGLTGAEGNPVVKSAVEVEALTKQLSSLKALQEQMRVNNAGESAMLNYSKSIESVTKRLEEAKKAQQSFSLAQKTGAGFKNFLGVGEDVAQAREAARQAQVIASGAGAAKVLSSALDSLAVKLGMSREQLNSFGGAAQAAGKSLQTFLTTTALINIGFTAASLLISAGISFWQQYEEKVRAARLESMRMADVNKVLASGWSSVIDAANRGDVASATKLEQARSNVQAAINIQAEKRNKLETEYLELNDRIARAKARIARGDTGSGGELGSLATRSPYEVVSEDLPKLLELKKQLLEIDRASLKAKEAYSLLDREQKNAEDVKVLAERRKDLEEKIKQTRIDYTKEVTDKEFQSTLERLNLERQASKARAEQEKNAISQMYQIMSNNSTDQEARSMQQLAKYKTALLDSTEAEAQRRSELEQKQMQMKKAIEDYAFKMAREKVRLEKELGGYQQQMEQYKNNMQSVRIQKELNAMREKAALEGLNYQPANLEQQQQFINAAQGKGDHRVLYAYLQMIPKSKLGGATGLDDPAVLIDRLSKYIQDLERKGQDTSLEGVARAQNLPADIVPKLISEAERKFNSTQWARPRNTEDITVPNLNIDLAGYQARLVEADRMLMTAMRALQSAQRAGDVQREEAILSEAMDPSRFTDIKADYTSDIEKAKTSISNLFKSFKSIETIGTFAEQKSNELDQNLKAQLRGSLRLLVEQGRLTEASVEKFIKDITSASGLLDPSVGVFLKGLDSATRIYILALMKGADTAANQAAKGAPGLFQLNRTNQFLEAIKNAFPLPSAQRPQSLRDIVSRTLDATNPVDETSSLQDRITRAREQAQGLIAMLRAEFPDVAKNLGGSLDEAAKNFVTSMTEIETSLEPLREKLRAALDPVTQLFKQWKKEIGDTRSMIASLAQGMASELGDAMSSAVSGVLSGTANIGEAFGSMFRNIAKSFIDMAMQMIAKALVMKALGILFPGLFPAPEAPAGGGGGGWNMFTNFKMANGGAFATNGIVPFAAGGIVSSPTLFRFAEGGTLRTGLMGEAGAEGILPLRRGPNGRLGVEAYGSGGGGISVVVNVDATGSKVEGDNSQANQLGRVISAAVQSELVKQKRPGGLLA